MSRPQIYLGAAEICQRLKCSRTSLWRYQHKLGFPVSLTPGGRLIVSETLLWDWFANLERVRGRWRVKAR
jgi:hypothetical protein